MLDVNPILRQQFPLGQNYAPITRRRTVYGDEIADVIDEIETNRQRRQISEDEAHLLLQIVIARAIREHISHLIDETITTATTRGENASYVGVLSAENQGA